MRDLINFAGVGFGAIGILGIAIWIVMIVRSFLRKHTGMLSLEDMTFVGNGWATTVAFIAAFFVFSKEFSFNNLLQTDPDRGDVVPVSPQRGTVPVRGEELDVDALVAALVHVLRQSEQTVPLVRVIEQEELAALSILLQDPKLHQELMSRTGTSETGTGNQVPDQQAEIEERTDPLGSQANPVDEPAEATTDKEREPGPTKPTETSAQKGPVEERLQAAYAQLVQQGTKITVEALRQAAACKKTAASEWLSRNRQQ